MVLVSPQSPWFSHGPGVSSESLVSSLLLVRPCDLPLFESKLQMCLSEFNRSLQHEPRGGCRWPQVKGGVSPLVDHLFMGVHQEYFSECGQVQDPPLTIVVLMVAPLVMCTLVLPMVCVHLTTSYQT
uniref:Uncharacterized protein n=1 Tax=Knipowitschia caucasica TaxID=637954 RepID=A0AAV2JUJ7_KNICA